MTKEIFTIKKALLIPVGLDAFLLLCLVLFSAFYRGSNLELTVFTVFFLPAAYLFLELLVRRISIDEEGLLLRKLWGKKALRWEAITHVGGLVIHNKVYILLTTVIGFFIISSSYRRFSALSEAILTRVDNEKLEEGLRTRIQNIPEGRSQTALAWTTAIILIGVVFLKLSAGI